MFEWVKSERKITEYYWVEYHSIKQFNSALWGHDSKGGWTVKSSLTLKSWIHSLILCHYMMEQFPTIEVMDIIKVIDTIAVNSITKDLWWVFKSVTRPAETSGRVKVGMEWKFPVYFFKCILLNLWIIHPFYFWFFELVIPNPTILVNLQKTN